MRALLIAAVICCLAGCGDSPPPAAPAKSKVDEVKLAKASARFTAFLEEAARGAELLESHPEAAKVEAQIKKLRGLLDEAADLYPDHRTMDELASEGKAMIRFFSASLSTIKYHETGKAKITEGVKKRIDEVSDKNAGAVRKMVESMQGKLGPPP